MRHNADTNNIDEAGHVHVPVMSDEIIRWVGDSPFGGKGMLVDCTLGEGGHSELLLKSFPSLRVTGFERDREILEIARKRLACWGDRITLYNDNFSQVAAYLDHRDEKPCYFLYDFGISSHHLERSGHGFAIMNDEPLDMRLDRDSGKDAAFLVNNLGEKELADIIYRYGEERWANKIARRICEVRRIKPLATTNELSALVLRAIPAKFHVRNIHPATRVFQALRIAVNDELGAIEKTLRAACGLLEPGGRIMAISFHSLEDRIVKDSFRRFARGCTCTEPVQRCMCSGKAAVKILTNKPLIPSEEEIRVNRRSRSAKLRVCERLEGGTL